MVDLDPFVSYKKDGPNHCIYQPQMPFPTQPAMHPNVIVTQNSWYDEVCRATRRRSNLGDLYTKKQEQPSNTL